MDKAQLKHWLRIAAVLVIVVLAIGLYKAKTDAAKTQARVHALEREVAETEAAMRALRAEIATLESPARVEALAERHLHADMGSESAALPESAIDARLPNPRPREGSRH